MDKFAKKTEHTMYAIFRIILGLVFALHGAQKLGWLGGAAKTGFMAFIGISELLIGLGILLGLFTRLAAIGGFIIMAGAMITVHWKNTFNPLAQGGGETAILYLIAFLIIFALGSGKFSLNHVFFKREML